MAAPDQPTTPIRGAIRVAIKNSTDNVDAGQQFSIFVTVQNPFEVPLTIHRVSSHIPIEFYEVAQRRRAEEIRALEQRREELDEVARSSGLAADSSLVRRSVRATGFLQRLRQFRFGALEMTLAPPSYPGPAIAQDLSISAVEVSYRIPLIGELRYSLPSKQKDATPDTEALKRDLNSEHRRIEEALKALTAPDTVSFSLQPGNSTTHVFTLRSASRLWFKPASYRLQIEIEYEIGGIKNVDTVEHTLQIKASLTSIILGALVGALGGWFVKHGASAPLNLSSIGSAVISLLLAAMAVVLFARKKDVQPLIAIEDFWGGIAIGFLTSYGGQQVLSRLLPTGTPANPAAGAA